MSPLRQIFLGQRHSNRLGLHHNARNSPSACLFDCVNAVDTARDLLSISLQRAAAPQVRAFVVASSVTLHANLLTLLSIASLLPGCSGVPTLPLVHYRHDDVAVFARTLACRDSRGVHPLRRSGQSSGHPGLPQSRRSGAALPDPGFVVETRIMRKRHMR